MADISRNTFTLTNLAHQIATGEPVTTPRHYVGVRQQQGRLLVDADFNEQSDIDKIQSEIYLKNYFGDGVPSSSNGFQIGVVVNPNNFSIATGIIMVDGKLVFNQHESLTYNEQNTLFSSALPPLTPPITGSRDDLVYLDTWEEEVLAVGGNNPDERLIDNTIGVETSARLERRWLVRVLEGSPTLSVADIPEEDGHSYLALAHLTRTSGQNQITVNNIFDMRRIDINVAKYLKIPLFAQQGVLTINSESFAEVLEFLRDILVTRLEEQLLFIDVGNVLGTTLVHFSIQQLLQICNTGALQSRTFNLTNENALTVLTELVAAQNNFIDTLDDHGGGGLLMNQFLQEYADHINGNGTLAGIATPLAENNLIGAFRGQQALNAWLSAPVNTLPEGDINISFISITPAGTLEGGTPYQVVVRVTSLVQSDAGSEMIDIIASLSSTLWSISPATQAVEVVNEGGQAEVAFTFIPSVGDPQCELSVVASVRNNPAIVSPQPPLLLQEGQEPVINPVLVYNHLPLNPQNQMQVPAAELQAFSHQVSFNLNNSENTQHTYTINWFITLDGGASETGWVPVESAQSTREDTVAAQSSESTLFAMQAPAGAITGITGTLHLVLTLVDGEDSNGITGGPDPHETYNVDFIVV